jgi:hypothetical protein
VWYNTLPPEIHRAAQATLICGLSSPPHIVALRQRRGGGCSYVHPQRNGRGNFSAPRRHPRHARRCSRYVARNSAPDGAPIPSRVGRRVDARVRGAAYTSPTCTCALGAVTVKSRHGTSASVTPACDVEVVACSTSYYTARVASSTHHRISPRPVFRLTSLCVLCGRVSSLSRLVARVRACWCGRAGAAAGRVHIATTTTSISRIAARIVLCRTWVCTAHMHTAQHCTAAIKLIKCLGH